jgi:hypothetical protein
MLLEIKPEYRAILAKSPNVVVDIPRSTPAHIRARLVASSIALCEKRSITPFEERCYQADATRFQASRPRPVIAVKKQIAAKPPVVSTLTAEDRRCGELALQYRALSYDQIRRAVKHGYGTDTLNALNLAEITKRSGFGFEVQAPAPRYQGGQSEDPTASLRDDDDDFDFDNDGAWDKSEHERAAEYHRALARNSSTMDQGIAHFKAADLHEDAAQQYPDLNSSFTARAASKNLRREKENCL